MNSDDNESEVVWFNTIFDKLFAAVEITVFSPTHNLNCACVVIRVFMDKRERPKL